LLPCRQELSPYIKISPMNDQCTAGDIFVSSSHLTSSHFCWGIWEKVNMGMYACWGLCSENVSSELNIILYISNFFIIPVHSGTFPIQTPQLISWTLGLILFLYDPAISFFVWNIKGIFARIKRLYSVWRTKPQISLSATATYYAYKGQLIQKYLYRQHIKKVCMSINSYIPTLERENFDTVMSSQKNYKLCSKCSPSTARARGTLNA
jgi:hypothetical protein